MAFPCPAWDRGTSHVAFPTKVKEVEWQAKSTQFCHARTALRAPFVRAKYDTHPPLVLRHLQGSMPLYCRFAVSPLL